MLSDDCKKLLWSWKFQSAANELLRNRRNATDDEYLIVRALAGSYGDVAIPFAGSMGEIVRGAVLFLIGPDYEPIEADSFSVGDLVP